MKLRNVILASVVGLSFIVNVSAQKTPKVLIIGIDGCRPDALLLADTPNIDRLWKYGGAYSFKAKTDSISYSGPCWTSILTGVWHQKHNVLSNKYIKPNTTQYPHIFTRLKAIKPDAQVISIVQWAPIHKILPSLDDPGVLALNFGYDLIVAKQSVSMLRVMINIDAMFVHLGSVDGFGHKYGFSLAKKSKYMKQIAKVDGYVGEIINALEERKMNKKEDWYVILTTDHGGSGKDHGQNIEAHTRTFYIINGKNVQEGGIKTPVNAVDVGVTALKLLDVPLKKEWNLDGKVVGLKKEVNSKSKDKK